MAFLKQLATFKSPYAPLCERIFASKDLLVHNELKLQPYESSTTPLLFSSHQSIRPNNYLFLLASNSFLAGNELAGASISEKHAINTNVESAKELFPHIDDSRLKITFQLLALQRANKQDQDTGYLKDYASLVFEQQSQEQVLSRFEGVHEEARDNALEQYYFMQVNQTLKIYEKLKENIMRGITPSQFVYAYQKVKEKSRTASGLSVMGPLLDYLSHSFTPNCALEGLFLTHRKQSFIALKNIMPLSSGQLLTINYGNFSNLELFFKFGFSVPNNPFDFIYVPLNVEELPELVNEGIEWKIKYLNKLRLGLCHQAKFIRGAILPEDLSVLRVLFSEKQEANVHLSDKNDTKILARLADKARPIAMSLRDKIAITKNPHMRECLNGQLKQLSSLKV